MRLSLILPLYNECSNLKRNFKKVYKAVQEIGNSEIILAEDGSTDCTKKYAKQFSKLNGVRFISSEQRLGKGLALKNAIRIAKGNVIGFIDIDLAVPVKYISVAVRMVERGNKIVVGSRYSKESRAKRSVKRLIASIVYNFLVRALLGSKVKDHQCGFKFWDAIFIKDFINEVKDNSWFFDAESIVRAQWNGVPVIEIPVEWEEQKDTKLKRSDIFYFMKSIIRLMLERR